MDALGGPVVERTDDEDFVVPAFGRETLHLRIRADSLRCEPPADQYNLADILGGDGTTESDSDIDLGRPVVVDLWVLELGGQNIVVEARQEGSPTAAMVAQLDRVLQSVRFASSQ